MVNEHQTPEKYHNSAGIVLSCFVAATVILALAIYRFLSGG